MTGQARSDPDFVIIGGGVYGCCLALFLRSISDSVVIIEQEETALACASRNNQARIHTGFHYPRSFVTALRSLALHRRFASDFPEAVVDDFAMLYAIARRRSKVSAARFERTFRYMGATFQRASRTEAAIFNPELIEQCFTCEEFAFDCNILRDLLMDRIHRAGIEISFSSRVEAVASRGDRHLVVCSGGRELTARTVFNVTYSGLNRLLRASGLETVEIKHEVAEIALIEPPAELGGLGITVMDGPFFSAMPFPSTGQYSLTHVRYTPHASWSDHATPYEAPSEPPASRNRHMLLDAARYLPAMRDAVWSRSLYETKTVLARNERDDGRPILFHRDALHPSVISVLGGKIDNIYDLFACLMEEEEAWSGAHDGYLTGAC